MTTEQLLSNLTARRQFVPFIPSRIVTTLVAVGAAIMLLGYFSFSWIDISYPLSSTEGPEFCYGWWRYLIPTVAVLVLVGLVARTFLKIRGSRLFWIGVAILGVSSLYPFYRLMNPGPDMLLAQVHITHSSGIWVVSEIRAGLAGSGFYITLAGALLLISAALGALAGRTRPNEG